MIAIPAPRMIVFAIFATLLLLVLMMLQHMLEAGQQGYRYFWTESLLFSTGWLYVLPISFGMVRVAPFIGKKNSLTTPVFMVIAAVVLQVLMFSVGVYLVSVVAMDHHYPIPGNMTYAVSSGLIPYLLVYTGVAFYIQRQKVTPGNTNTPTTLELAEGSRKFLVRATDIILITAADPYVAIHTADRKFLHRTSLREMETKLGREFVRVHRSAIVNSRSVLQTVSRGNGDHDLVLDGGYHTRLSRRYLADFRTRLADLASA